MRDEMKYVSPVNCELNAESERASESPSPFVRP